jgi:hypothetical protein
MKISHLLILFLLFCFSCSPEKEYQYEVNPVTISQNSGPKGNQKSTTEFIAIAYTDLFGTTIPQSKLIDLSIAYTSFGDLKVIEERIIRNLLNDTSVIIPAVPSVAGDTSVFISNTYKKFFNREPNEFEKHYWKELIRANASVQPDVMYFALMTSDEYRFY